MAAVAELVWPTIERAQAGPPMEGWLAGRCRLTDGRLVGRADSVWCSVSDRIEVARFYLDSDIAGSPWLVAPLAGWRPVGARLP